MRNWLVGYLTVVQEGTVIIISQHRNKEEIVKTKANYKNKDHRNIWIAIFMSLLSAPFIIGCFIGEVLIIMTAISHRIVGLISLIMPLPFQLFFYRLMYSYILIADSSIFDITFYNDRLEYIGLFKNKTINYSQVILLTNLTLELSARGGHVEKEVLQIKTLNNKRVQICIEALSKEDAKKLKQDLPKYLGMKMNLKTKNLLLFK